MIAEEGVDYAFTSVDEKKLYAADKRFAGRYTGPGSTAKHLTPAERDRIFAAGLDIMLLAEGSTGDPLQGYALGLEQGRSALAGARSLGAPDAAAIYAAVDFDCGVAQWPLVLQYFRGFAAAVGPSRVGIYGSYRVMQWAARDKAASYFFQTYAWSGGLWFAGNHVEQYHNGVALADGEVDLCRSKQLRFGQWLAVPPPPPSPGDDMTPEEHTWLEETHQWVKDVRYALFTADPGTPTRSADSLAGRIDDTQTAVAALTGGGGTAGLTAEQVRAVVREELDKTKLGS